jgi:hypothetical protein
MVPPFRVPFVVIEINKQSLQKVLDKNKGKYLKEIEN